MPVAVPDRTLFNVCRLLSEAGRMRRGDLLASLASTQRPYVDQAIAACESRGWVAVEPYRTPWARAVAYRWVRSGVVIEPPERSPAQRESLSESYPAVHQRLRRERGPARQYDCAGCGRRATEWAYDHADTHELEGPTKHGRGDRRRYSLDLDHYLPLCHSCHVRLDVGATPEACKRGHPLAEHGRIRPCGRTACRECDRTRQDRIAAFAA